MSRKKEGTVMNVLKRAVVKLNLDRWRNEMIKEYMSVKDTQ